VRHDGEIEKHATGRTPASSVCRVNVATGAAHSDLSHWSRLPLNGLAIRSETVELER
jgi:hypothetical protein